MNRHSQNNSDPQITLSFENPKLRTPFSYRVQKTLAKSCEFHGNGLHSGEKTKIRLVPAEANSGISFLRKDLKNAKPIAAHFENVVATNLATTLGESENSQNHVGTVEHLMAALFATGITNLVVEVWGSEIPILDGSAAPFVQKILSTGATLQPFSTATLKVYRPIKTVLNGAICELLPCDRLRVTTSIEFSHPSIGLQTYALELTPNSFGDHLCEARTFGFMSDLEKLQEMKLARGASLDNVLAFSEEGIVNKEGARFEDECVRHKVLDAIGDLALCGCWIEGELVDCRGGHTIHRKLLQNLNQFQDCWEMLPPEPIPHVLMLNKNADSETERSSMNDPVEEPA